MEVVDIKEILSSNLLHFVRSSLWCATSLATLMQMRVEKNPKHLHIELIVTSHNSVFQTFLLLFLSENLTPNLSKKVNKLRTTKYNLPKRIVSNQKKGKPKSKSWFYLQSAVQLLFDYEAFQVDRHGSLIFTRSLGHQRIDNFCIDSVSPEPI